MRRMTVGSKITLTEIRQAYLDRASWTKVRVGTYEDWGEVYRFPQKTTCWVAKVKTYFRPVRITYHPTQEAALKQVEQTLPSPDWL